MIRYIGIGVGALLWGLGTFALALRVHFPDEALIQRAQWEVQSSSKGDWLLKVEDASPWRMTGVTLENATLYKAARPTPRRRRNADADAEAPAPEPVLTTSALSVRMSPLALLRGQQAAHFEADLYDGSLEGDVALGAGETSIAALAEDLDLSLVPFSGKSWSMDASGRMKLDMDMTINKEEIKESAGHINLAIDGFTINSGELMGFTLDKPTVFTEAVIEMVAENGKMEIQKGSFVSDTVTITVGGSITLAPTLRRTRLQLKLTFDLADDLDMLAKNLPQLKNARDDEGIYHFLVSGTFATPSFREDRIGVRRAGGAPLDSTRGRIESKIRQEDEGLSDEEREQRRAERLERMQERMQRGRGNAPGEGPDMPQRPGLRPPGSPGNVGGERVRRGPGLEGEVPGYIPNDEGMIPEPDFGGEPDEIAPPDEGEVIPIEDEGFIEEEQ